MTPEEKEQDVLKDGLLDFVEFTKSAVETTTDPKTVINRLQSKLNFIQYSARKAKAMFTHNNAHVTECQVCLGNGTIAMAAGDTDWCEICEQCDGTGFVPQNEV